MEYVDVCKSCIDELGLGHISPVYFEEWQSRKVCARCGAKGRCVNIWKKFLNVIHLPKNGVNNREEVFVDKPIEEVIIEVPATKKGRKKK